MRRLHPYLITLLLLWQAAAMAQPCANDYQSIRYQGGKKNAVHRTALTPTGEIFMAGDMANGQYEMLTDCWVTKTSAGGTVLWSKRYAAEGFNACTTRDIAAVSDGGFVLLAGVVFINVSTSAILANGTIVIRCDKYGNIRWAKQLPGTKITDYSWLTVLDGDDVLVCGTSGYAFPDKNSSCHYIRLRADGTTAWNTKLQSNEYFFGISTGTRAFIQNNTLAICAAQCFKMNANWDNYDNAAYMIAALNLATGQAVWKKVYNSNNITVSVLSRFGPVAALYEKANGDIVLVGAVSETIPIPDPPGFRKTLELTCDRLGNIQDIQTYYNNQPGTKAVAARAAGNQGQTLLLDDGVQPVLMGLDATGNVALQKAFGTVARQEASSLVFANNRYSLFTTERGNNRFVRLVQTNTNGEAPCEETPAQIVKESPGGILVMQSPFFFEAQEGPTTLPVLLASCADYPLQATVECRQNCCTEKQGPVVTYELCGVSSFTLPNGEVVKDSGTYYQHYTSFAGCDSIAYYRVLFSQPPVLDIAPLQCLPGSDTLWLEAPAGYPVYNWMNGLGTQRRFAVTLPGNYTVTVRNGCGSATATVEVPDNCNLAIRMPSGFTPNGDGVNDIFSVPPQNRGRILRFDIFNRWGQSIFRSNTATPGWNGFINGRPAPPGAYVYTLTMSSPDGKTVKQHQGWVVLMR